MLFCCRTGQKRDALADWVSISQIVDDVKRQRIENRNVLTIKKKL